MNAARILILDDDPDVLAAAKLLLKRHYNQVDTETNPERLLTKLREGYDLLLLDMNFGGSIQTGNEGLFWIDQVRQPFPNLKIVCITAYGDVGLAVEAVKRGASDFVLKPWENERLLETLSQCLQGLKAVPRKPQKDKPQMIGSSPTMLQVQQIAAQTAPTDASILITGENGTGKDVLARQVHQLSSRSAGPFVAVDLGAIPTTLFESELFGHKKGAFTDAHSDKPGRMTQANGGTLFLDEIGNLATEQQAKLLGVLQNREVMPLGGRKPEALDVRLICATNSPLETRITEGSFRPDLYYRINTIQLHLPPLRERVADVPLIANYFLDKYNQHYHRSAQLNEHAIQLLQRYKWPGNVRELQHVIERAVILCRDTQIGPELLNLSPESPAAKALANDPLNLEDQERQTITSALSQHSGNISAAAKALGLSRAALYRRIEKYGI